jgi:hypothetical protein
MSKKTMMRSGFCLALFFVCFQAHAVKIVEDFSDLTFYDVTTNAGVGVVNRAVWNPSFGYLHAPMTNASAANFDVGDGSAGACTVSGNVTTLAPFANCLTLNIANATFDLANTVTLSAMYGITVSGNAVLNGANGTNGLNSAGTSAGGVTRNGGKAGGQGNSGSTNGANGTDFGVHPNGGAGAGGQGQQEGAFPGVDQAGGGGAGGLANNAFAASATNDGVTGVSGLAGAGATATDANVAMVAANVIGYLHTNANDVGGVGGGGGGGGEESGGAAEHRGGGGGAGGGTLYLRTLGSITITGSITAVGGRGGNTNGLGGGGGGGSGGFVGLEAAAGYSQTGSINLSGGSGGVATGAGGNGGSGGVGILASDNSALLGGNMNYTTAASTSTSLAYDTGGTLNEFTFYTAVQDLAGGTITLEFDQSDDGTTWDGFVPAASYNTLTKRYVRFRATVTGAGGADTPKLYKLELNYNILQKAQDYNFESDITCGTIGPPDDKNNFLSALVGLMIAGFLSLFRKSQY